MKSSIFKNILGKTEKILISVDTILLAFVTLLVVIQVIARSFGFVLTGTEELARFSYVLFAFLAWPVAALQGTDVSVTVLFDKFPSKVRQIMLGFFHCLMAFFAILVLISTIKSLNNVKGMVASGNIWFRMEWLYIGVAIGVTFTILFNIVRSLKLWTGLDIYLTQEERDNIEIEGSIKALEEGADK